MAEESFRLFQSQLDVRSAVSTSLNLTLLTSLLLSDEQLLLFKNQHARVVNLETGTIMEEEADGGSLPQISHQLRDLNQDL